MATFHWSRWTFWLLQRKRNPLTDDNDRSREAALLTPLQRRTDELTAVYLLVTASLMVLFREQVAHWPFLFCLHLTTAALLLWLRPLSSQSRSFWKVLHDWYPVMVFLLLWKRGAECVSHKEQKAYPDPFSSTVPTGAVGLFGSFSVKEIP